MSLTRRVLLACVFAQVLPLAIAAADPYPPPENAAADLTQARQRAKASGRMLMVVFGGNWCPDCRWRPRAASAGGPSRR